jgi:hypothetical protein
MTGILIFPAGVARIHNPLAKSEQAGFVALYCPLNDHTPVCLEWTNSLV